MSILWHHVKSPWIPPSKIRSTGCPHRRQLRTSLCIILVLKHLIRSFFMSCHWWLCSMYRQFQNVIVLGIVKTEFLSRSFLTILSQGLITNNMKTEVNKESELKINLGFLEFLKLPLPSLDINWYNVPSSWWSDPCQCKTQQREQWLIMLKIFQMHTTELE